MSLLVVGTWAQGIAVDAPRKVGMGDYFSLTFTVSSMDVSNFKAPSLHAFDILSGPNESRNHSYTSVNGKSSYAESLTITYVLQPTKKGVVQIPAATAVVNGKTISSRPITIEIVEGSTSSAAAHRPQRNIGAATASPSNLKIGKNDLFFTVTPSKTTVFEQEAVLLTYKFYCSDRVGLQSIGIAKRPEIRDVFSEQKNNPDISNYQTEVVNGRRYVTNTVLQQLIFPQKAGKIVVPGITFSCDIAQEMTMDNVFDSFFNGGNILSQKVQRTCPELTLQVLPLPQPKPANFTGAVGKYSVSGEMLTKQLKSNDLCTYRVTIEGVGNMKLLSAPNFRFPKDFDNYDPKINEQTTFSSEGQSGSVTIDYTFVPRNIGKYNVEGLKFVYFDTDARAYKTIQLPAMQFNVTKGTRSDEEVEREKALMGADLGDIIKENAGTPLLSWGSWAYWLIYLVLIGGFITLLPFLRKWLQVDLTLSELNFKRAGNKISKRFRSAVKLLHKNDKRGFYVEINKALNHYLTDKFGLQPSEQSAERIARCFQENQIDETLLQRFQSLQEQCEYARFAPVLEGTNEQDVLHEAEHLIQDIERALKHSTSSAKSKI